MSHHQFNFCRFDTGVTNAKTDKGTLDWTKGMPEIDAVSVI